MSDLKSVTEVYNSSRQWLVDVNKHQLIQMIDFVENAKLICSAAEAIPEDKIKQFIGGFSYDLHAFYLRCQVQIQHSIYLGLINEYLWRISVNITDKSQVEWAELGQDFYHHGYYQQGDLIGFWLLLCKKCQNTQLISHLTTVDECVHCGHGHFFRQSFNP